MSPSPRRIRATAALTMIAIFAAGVALGMWLATGRGRSPVPPQGLLVIGFGVGIFWTDVMGLARRAIDEWRDEK